jgi:hypothetical protein
VLNLPTPSLNAIYFTDSENGWGAGVIGAILKFSGGTTAVHDKTTSRAPEQFVLHQNYPNPFWSGATSRSAGNPSTTIQFSLPQREHVTLKVFDVNGREVATLVEGEMAAGNHAVTFAPGETTTGLYFYKLTAGKFSQTRKAVVMR